MSHESQANVSPRCAWHILPIFDLGWMLYHLHNQGILSLREFILPTEQLSRQAADALQDLAQVLGSAVQTSYAVRFDNAPDLPVALPGEAVRLLRALLSELANYNAVNVTTLPAELSMQEAAEILDIQGPLLVSLIENGKLPHRRVGARPVLRLSDVIDYKRNREVETRELAALSAEMKEDGGGWPL